MITSPQSGPEWENAIRETLVTGEELISFSNGWVHIDGAVPTGSLPSRYTNAFQWTYLALTNINLRFGQWGYDHQSIWAEAFPTGAWGLDQISTYKSSTFSWSHYVKHERPIANVLPMNPLGVEYIFFGERRYGRSWGGFFKNRIGTSDKYLPVTALVIGILWKGVIKIFYKYNTLLVIAYIVFLSPIAFCNILLLGLFGDTKEQMISKKAKEQAKFDKMVQEEKETL